MRFTTVICLALVISGCGNRISPYFANNSYISQMYSHVVNDSLELHHKSFGDIEFAKTKKELKQAIRKYKHVQNVLIYGKTNTAPFYEYFVELRPETKILTKNSNENFIKDTVLGGLRYTFKGFSSDSLDASQDFNQIFTNISVGNDYKTDIGSFYEVLNSFNKSNRFLNALREISEFPVRGSGEESFKLQMQLTYASFLGDNTEYQDLIKKWETNALNDSIIKRIENHAVEGKAKVLPFIMDKTKDARLVMFNENHFYPNHRRILIDLLPKYRDVGFTYLALEALAENQDSVLNSGGPLTVETGYYTREQNFGELIMTAQSLGFNFVAYENVKEKTDREVEQAKNLYQKTFAKDDGAKVLVLAGIAHIYEHPDTKGKRWMAATFKENYGMDPITFSQTTLNGYREQTKDLAVVNSKVFDGKRFGTTDYLVLNNLGKEVATANFSYKNLSDKPVQLALFDDSNFKSERSFFDKVPIRSYLLMPRETYTTHIKIPEVQIILFDEKGRVLENKKVDILDEK